MYSLNLTIEDLPNDNQIEAVLPEFIRFGEDPGHCLLSRERTFRFIRETYAFGLLLADEECNVSIVRQDLGRISAAADGLLAAVKNVGPIANRLAMLDGVSRIIPNLCFVSSRTPAKVQSAFELIEKLRDGCDRISQQLKTEKLGGRGNVLAHRLGGLHDQLAMQARVLLGACGWHQEARSSRKVRAVTAMLLHLLQGKSSEEGVRVPVQRSFDRLQGIPDDFKAAYLRLRCDDLRGRNLEGDLAQLAKIEDELAVLRARPW